MAHWTIACGLALASGLLPTGAARAEVTPEILAGGVAADAQRVGHELSEAIALFRLGNIDDARALLSIARKKVPQLSPVEVMLATLLIDVGQGAGARTELEKAVRQFPADPEAYGRLAELDVADGRITEAGLMFAKAIELADAFDESPKRRRQVQFRALLGATAIAENRDQWSAARDFLQALTRAEPNNALLQQRLAKALFHLSEIKQARQALEAAAAADPKAMPADLVLAGFFLQSGDRASADEYIQKIADGAAESATAQLGLARFWLQAGDVERAKAHAARARELDPLSSEAKVLSGIIARLSQDLDTALTLMEQVHLESPRNVDANNQLALILIDRPDEASGRRAIEFAELNHRLHPNHSESVATLAWVMYRQGRKSEAERLFAVIAGAVSSGSAPVSGDAIYHLAKFHADEGRKLEARRLLDLLLSRGVPGFYRQEAQALLAQLKEPADTDLPADDSGPDESDEKDEAPEEPKSSPDEKSQASPALLSSAV